MFNKVSQQAFLGIVSLSMMGCIDFVSNGTDSGTDPTNPINSSNVSPSTGVKPGGNLFPWQGGEGSKPPYVLDLPSNELLEEASIVKSRFRVSLREFSSEVASGYNDCTDLARDLEQVGRLYANQILDQQENGWNPNIMIDLWNDSGLIEQDLIGIETTNLFKISLESTADKTTQSQAGFGVPTSVAKDVPATMTSTTSDSMETSVQNLAGSSAKSSSTDGYETNNQVKGVDEADVVKSDGDRIYIAYGSEILVYHTNGDLLDRFELPQLKKALLEDMSQGELDLENLDDTTNSLGSIKSTAFNKPLIVSDSQVIKEFSHITAFLLSFDRLVVISNVTSNRIYSIAQGLTRVSIFSVDSSGKLQLQEESLLRGSYQSAREIDGKAHIVTQSAFDQYRLYDLLNPRYWRGPFPVKSFSVATYRKNALEKAATLIPRWRDAIMKSLLADADGKIYSNACHGIIKLYQPQESVTAGSTEEIEAPFRTPVIDGFAQISSFDIKKGFSSETRAGGLIPVGKMTVYSSQNKIFLATEGWQQLSKNQWRASTQLIEFSMITTGFTSPVAAGSIDGRLLNQFSMDYHKDALRVATTVDASWSTDAKGNWYEKKRTNNKISVLTEVSEPGAGSLRLKTIGEADGLGRGEQIYAVRFLGDRGFVVTFRQTDPFYTLDLSNPASPRVVGELKIPGFSNYLHPLGDNHLIAIGQDATEEGRPSGLQVAVFDVSDLAHPRQIHKHLVSGESSSSSAQYDSHAFRYFDAENLLVLPVSYITYPEKPKEPPPFFDFETGKIKLEAYENPQAVESWFFKWTQPTYFDGFQVFKISPKDGISFQGEISHDTAYCEPSSVDSLDFAPYYYNYSPFLEPRSLIFDQTQQLVTMKGSEIQSHSYDTSIKNWNSTLCE